MSPETKGFSCLAGGALEFVPLLAWWGDWLMLAKPEWKEASGLPEKESAEIETLDMPLVALLISMWDVNRR